MQPGTIASDILDGFEGIATNTVGRIMKNASGLEIYGDPMCMDQTYAKLPENKARCEEVIQKSNEQYKQQYNEEQKFEKMNPGASSFMRWWDTGRVHTSSLINAGGQVCKYLFT